MDLPPFKILGNDRLMELAIWAGEHPHAGLARFGKFPRHFSRKRLESLETVIHRARQLRPSDWPEPRIRGTGTRPLRGKTFNRLRADLAHLVEELGLTPSVVAPRSALEQICRLQPTDAAKIQKASGLMPWQAELLAPIVRSALSDD